MQNRLGDLLRCHHPRLILLVTARVRFVVKTRIDGPRANQRHANAVLPHILQQGLRKPVHGVLAREIPAAHLRLILPRQRRDIEDVTPTVFLHPGHGQARHVECPEDVDAELTLEFVILELVNRAEDADACVVDEKIRIACCVDGLAGKLLAILPGRDIQFDCGGGVSFLLQDFDCSLDLLGIPSAQDYMRPGTCEGESDCSSDSSAGSCDPGGLSVEVSTSLGHGEFSLSF